MGLMSSIFSAGIGAVGDLLNTALSNAMSRKSAQIANKDTWQYYQKQKELDYQYDRNQYYELDKLYSELEYNLQKRYAENSSKWLVQGLRSAGLNPLLAATDGNFGAIQGGVVQSDRHSSSMTGMQKASVSPSDLIGSAAKSIDSYSRLVGNENTEANTDLANANKDLVDEKIKTERTQQQLNAANTARSLVDAKNNTHSGGDNTWFSQMLHSAKDWTKGVYERIKREADDNFDRNSSQSLFRHIKQSDSGFDLPVRSSGAGSRSGSHYMFVTPSGSKFYYRE